MKKQVWTMIDIVKVSKRVDFGEAVTIERAIEMWLEESYAYIIEEQELEILDFVEAR